MAYGRPMSCSQKPATGSGYPQAFVDQTPKYDSKVRKPRRKKKGAR